MRCAEKWAALSLGSDFLETWGYDYWAQSAPYGCGCHQKKLLFAIGAIVLELGFAKNGRHYPLAAIFLRFCGMVMGHTQKKSCHDWGRRFRVRLCEKWAALSLGSDFLEMRGDSYGEQKQSPSSDLRRHFWPVGCNLRPLRCNFCPTRRNWQLLYRNFGLIRRNVRAL